MRKSWITAFQETLKWQFIVIILEKIRLGQLTFVPTGCWHDIENIGEELKIVIVYNNERFEDLGISGSVGSLPTRILNSIFGISSPGLFDELGDLPSQDVYLVRKQSIFLKSLVTRRPKPQFHILWILVIPLLRYKRLVELLFWEVYPIFQYSKACQYFSWIWDQKEL